MRPEGSYILVLHLAEGHGLQVGKLGRFDFAAGCYLYFGSALNGLHSRVARHLKSDKKRHWHIDALTAIAQVVQVWCVVDRNRWECTLAKAVADMPYATVPAKGFGSSDCRCNSHLLYLADCGDVASAKATLLQTCPNLIDWSHQDIGTVCKSPP